MALEPVDLRALVLATRCLAPEDRGEVLFLGRPRLFFDWQAVQVLAMEFGLNMEDPGDIPLTPHTLAIRLGFHGAITAGLEGDTDLHIDLTSDIPADLLARFSLVVDAGVLYWCFDPGVVLRNVRSMVRQGGSIIHVTAITGFFGRGAYSVQPRTLFAFYASNGGVCDHAIWRTRPRRNLRRIARGLLGLGRVDTGLHGRVLAPGDVFWGRKHPWRRAGFYPDPSVRATRRIPNDLLGTYVFRIVNDQRSRGVTLLERGIS